MTTGCGRCRRHPGSKKRPWNVEPASADALRPGPPARLAKASLRKMRPAVVWLPVAMPGPAGLICSGPARYERMLPAVARTVARTLGADVPDVRATRAGQD